MSEPLPFLDADELMQLAKAREGRECPACASLKAPGWESMPGSFDTQGLRPIGTLRDDRDDDPTLEEFHPERTQLWSAEAPVAPRWFPYNRCEVAECSGCGRVFLRYTEYGGYYVDPRIRELAPARIVDAPR